MVNGVFSIPLSATSPAMSRGSTLPVCWSEFVAGPENSLVAAALAPLLQRAETNYSPLVIYGPHGSGKSHLARGLAEWWRAHHVGLHDASGAVVCLSGSEFAQQYNAGLDGDTVDAWRSELRSAQLFILDDLDELSERRGAQQELIRTLDALNDRDVPTVITADDLPSHGTAMIAPLRGRLSAGLAIPLSLPGPDARRDILSRLYRARGLSLPAAVLDDLAAELSGSVPMLVAAILELELRSRTVGGQIDSKRIRAFVAGRSAGTQHTLREIALLAARYFGLRLADLKSPARQRSLVAGRAVAMYLCRKLTSESLEKIGDFFGGRDHTTVLHACRRTEKLLRRDRATRQAVAELKQLLATT